VAGSQVVSKALEFPLALWTIWCCRSSGSWTITLTCRVGPSGQVGAQAAVPSMLRPSVLHAVAAEAACWRRSCTIGQAAAPQSPARGCGRLAEALYVYGEAAGLQRCWSENRGFLSQLCILNLALLPPILYKRRPIAFQLATKTLKPSAWDNASDNTPREDTDMAVSPKTNTRPPARGSAARRTH